MTEEEFKADVMAFVKERPEEWRAGQAVFNWIDAEYGVARKVQFEDGIDCFYVRDENSPLIDQFIVAAYKQYSKLHGN